MSVFWENGAFLKKEQNRFGNYYPFGLIMAGISSQAAGKLENLHKFNKGSELQHKEFSDGSGLEAYDANFRMYDAQIGRFWQQDPLGELAEDQSLYSYVDNNPVSFADALGLTDSTIAPGFENSTTGANNLAPVAVSAVAKPQKQALTADAMVPASAVSAGAIAQDLEEIGATMENEEFLRNTISTSEVIIAAGGGPEDEWADGISLLNLAGGYAIYEIAKFSINSRSNTNSNTNNNPSTAPYQRPVVTNPYVGYGNNKKNTNPHIVYEFSFTPKDGKTPILKYGISDEFRWGMERPESQEAGFVAQYGASVKWKILTRTVDRASALAEELRLVAAHKVAWNELPREQVRPDP